MTFQLFDMDGNVFEPEKMISYELVSEAEAPCDGLRLSFSCKIYSVPNALYAFFYYDMSYNCAKDIPYKSKLLFLHRGKSVLFMHEAAHLFLLIMKLFRVSIKILLQDSFGFQMQRISDLK